MSIVLGNQPIPVLKLQIIRIEGVRDGITKWKLADDFFKRSWFYRFANRRSVSRVCSACSNKVRSTWVEFYITKTSFQESEHDDDSFRKNVHISSWFRCRQGNWMAEMPASLIASTWSLIIILHNYDATNTKIFSSRAGRSATTSFCLSKLKTAWCCFSFSTFLLENCAKQSSSTLSIVSTAKQKICSTQACSMTAFQVAINVIFLCKYNRKCHGWRVQAITNTSSRMTRAWWVVHMMMIGWLPFSQW